MAPTRLQLRNSYLFWTRITFAIVNEVQMLFLAFFLNETEAPNLRFGWRLVEYIKRWKNWRI